MHVRTEFHFTVDAPYKIVAPLFGADAERAWVGQSWNPTFIYPDPPADIEGAVFKVEHGGHKSVWTNTAFDLNNGHVQYVYIMEDILTTLIDIHIDHTAPNRTTVRVAYERTALIEEANEHVKQLAESDSKAGPEWASSIGRYLKKSNH